MNVNWLALSANVAGFLGAVLLALPFFRENRLKRLGSDLSPPIIGSGGTEEALKMLQNSVEKRIREWKPADYRLAISGIALLGLYHFLNIVGSFLGIPVH